MSTTLSKRGYVLLKKDFPPDVIQKCKEELLMRPELYDEKMAMNEEFPIYRENSAKLYLPRYYGYQKFGTPKVISDKEGKSIDLNFDGSLRDVQKPVIEKFMERMKCPVQGGILDLPCGFGKTSIACYLISLVKRKTLVIVHKEFLMEQWIERIKQFLPGAKIGIIQGDEVKVDDKDIVLGMLQSISMKDYPDEVFDDFGLTIIDECHHMGSKVFSRALHKISSKVFIGLSATPDRKDGLSKVFYYSIGDPIIRIQRGRVDNVLIKEVHLKGKNIDYYINEVRKDGKPNMPQMITNLTLYPERNQICVDILRELFKDFGKTLVLSERREHLEEIGRLLDEQKLDYGFYVGRSGSSKKKYKITLKETEEKPIILATYQMAREGLDIRNMTKLLFATPMVDIEQSVGRILRDTEEMLKNGIVLKVVDVIDEFAHFSMQGYKRRMFFRANQYCITKHKVNLNKYDVIEEKDNLSRFIQDKTIYHDTFVNECEKDTTEIKLGNKCIIVDDE